MTSVAPPRSPEAAPTAHAVRRDIQGLRAIAVLSVIAAHAGLPYVDGGFVGVDVFFVLSGFLITSLLVREADRSGRISIAGFYARRARRILPAATVVLVAIVVFSAIELSYGAAERAAEDSLWAAFFLANVHFARLGTDYFSEGLPPSPVQHYWSLAVEEQFYVVWPTLLALLLLGIARHNRRHPDRAPRSPWPLITTAAVLLCGASLAWSVVQTGTNPTAAYFSSFTRAWELGAGMLLAIAGARCAHLPTVARHVLTVGGLAAIGIAMVAYSPTTPFPGYQALLPVLGTVAVLAAGVGTDGTGVGRLLMVRPMTWIGDLSYSLYLWHWPVLVLWAERNGDEKGPLETTALLIVILALSAVSYYCVENPIRNSRGLRLQWRSLALWPAAIALTVLVVLGAQSYASQEVEDHLADSGQFEGLRTQDIPVEQELARSVDPARADAPIEFPLTDLDDVDDLAKDLWNFRYTCFVPQDRSEARICPVGDVDADRTMVVVGDSHIGMWLPAFDALGAEHGYRVVPLIKLGCPPFDVDLNVPRVREPYTTCSDFQDWAIAEIGRLSPEVVYVGGRGMPRNMVAAAPDRPAAWTEGVRSFIEQVTPLTPALRVLADVSLLGFEPIDCLTDVDATMGSCSSPEDARVLEANDLTREASEDLGVPYVDVTPLACFEGRCPAFAGGRMVYANVDHLSMDWVEHVTPDLEQLIALPR